MNGNTVIDHSVLSVFSVEMFTLFHQYFQTKVLDFINLIRALIFRHKPRAISARMVPGLLGIRVKEGGKKIRQTSFQRT